jgi:MFS transporter, DHA1 family, multidrug resistance protein
MRARLRSGLEQIVLLSAPRTAATILKLDPKSSIFILFLGAQSALPPLSIDSSLPALPMVGAALNASPAAVQWTLSGFLIGFASGQMLWGQAADRFGRRPILLVGLCLYVFAGIGCALAPSIGVLIAMRLLQGVGACAGGVMARAMVRDCFEGDAAIAKQAMLGLVAPLAMLIAPILGGVILGLYNWRISYAMLPLSGGLLAIATALWLPETKQPALRMERVAFFTAAARFFATPRALGFALLNALTFGAMFGYISGSSVVLIGHFIVSPSVFGVLFSGAAIALIGGALFANLSLRPLSPKTSRQFGLAFLAAALILLICFSRTDSLGIVLLGGAAITFATGALAPHAIANAMAPLPQIAGTASGLIGASQFVVGALSATLIGLNQAGTVAGMFTTMSLFAGAALLVGLLLEMRSREPTSL